MWTRILTVGLCLSVARVAAQNAPITETDLPWTSGDDPIGVRREDADLDRGPTPTRAPDAQAYGPKPPALSARSGDVIVAPALVRETRHKVHLAWRAGLTLVTTELHFTTTGSFAAEVKYRLPLPAAATLASLEVCAPVGCRDGLVEPSESLLSAYDDAVQSRGPANALPVGHARMVEDERGAAVSLRAAPVRANQDLVVRVAFLVPTPVRGGVVRFTLPARGLDERAASAEVTLDAPALTAVSLADAPITASPALLEPWRPIPFAGRFQSSSALTSKWLRYPCGEQECARLWLAARNAEPLDPDLAIVLDASPSMRGPARGRIAVALAALLAVIRPERPIDVAVFAARARLVQQSVAASETRLPPLVDAAQAEDLGSGTRFQAAWDVLGTWTQHSVWPRRKQIVVLGDASISRHQDAAFEAAEHLGIAVSWVNLTDRSLDPELRALVERTHGIVIDAGPHAAVALANRDPGPLEEALSELVAARAASQVTLRTLSSPRNERINLGTLRAGTEIVWNGVATPRARLLGITDEPRNVRLLNTERRIAEVDQRLEQALAAAFANPGRRLVAVDPADITLAGQHRPPPAPQCDVRGPAQRASGISSDLDPVSLAETRPCRLNRVSPVSPSAAAPGPTGATGLGMPASPLLTMLRQRILPVARACFRRDRAGRAEYELRATFDLELSNQEVADASVVGDVPEPLRACLIDAAERLEVPLFSGTVRARYPLRTQSEPLPDEIELTPGVAADLDRLLDGDRGALHTPPAF